MLNQIKFTNFKSWASVAMPCRSITGIFGTNSSGKTSLLQFLLLLKQTKEATDRGISLELNGDLLKLGTIKDAIHLNEEGRTIKWSIGFDLDKELALEDPSGNKNGRKSIISKAVTLTVKSAVGVQQNTLKSTNLSYELGDMQFSITSENTKDFKIEAEKVNGSRSDFSFTRTQGRAWQLPGPIKSYAFPDQARTYFQNAGFLADLEVAYEKSLDRVFYLGPLREFPQRDYLWAGSRPTDVGQRGQRTIDAILAATEQKETRNLRARGRFKPFQEIIAYWLRKMGLIYEFRMHEIAVGSNRWQARVRTRKNSTEVLLTDVGFGVSQVLPVITLLQYVPEGSTVILEQPEIHLHPLAQAELAEVIIQAALHRNVQVILESHSEHLLLRLQRRIADGALSKEKIELYFCDAPDGISHLTKLDLDLYGNILNWPEKFMGDAFTEMAEAELARLKRMSALK
jgi:predicted ATPase